MYGPLTVMSMAGQACSEVGKYDKRLVRSSPSSSGLVGETGRNATLLGGIGRIAYCYSSSLPPRLQLPQVMCRSSRATILVLRLSCNPVTLYLNPLLVQPASVQSKNLRVWGMYKGNHDSATVSLLRDRLKVVFPVQPRPDQAPVHPHRFEPHRIEVRGKTRMAISVAVMSEHIRILAEDLDRKARREVFSDGRLRRQRATATTHDWAVAQSEAELEHRARILFQLAEVERIEHTVVHGKNITVNSAEYGEKLSHELLKTIRASNSHCA